MPSTLDELLKIARHAVSKQAFVDAATAGGGGAPPMDPAAMGGMPMDPAAMGGAPPPTDPAAAGGGGGGDPALTAKIDQLITMMGQGGAGGGAGGAGGLKPKIDVNVEIMQIKNILAKIADTLGVQIPAQDMVATPEKLTAMAQGQSTQTPMPGPGGAAPPGGGSAIPAIEPMQGASPALAGGGGAPPGGGEKAGEDSLMDIGRKAAALNQIIEMRRRGNR